MVLCIDGVKWGHELLLRGSTGRIKCRQSHCGVFPYRKLNEVRVQSILVSRQLVENGRMDFSTILAASQTCFHGFVFQTLPTPVHSTHSDLIGQ